MRGKRSLTIVSVLTAGGLVITGVGVSNALTTATTHTLKFKSIQLTSHNIDHSTSLQFINTDKDEINGKYAGSDVFEGNLSRTDVVSTIAAFALNGGFIYAKTTSNGKVATGKVTGGTGSYKGIRGTIRLAGSQDAPTVTITYRG